MANSICRSQNYCCVLRLFGACFVDCGDPVAAATAEIHHASAVLMQVVIGRDVTSESLCLEPIDLIEVSAKMAASDNLPLPVFRAHAGHRSAAGRVTDTMTVAVHVIERSRLFWMRLEYMIKRVLDHWPVRVCPGRARQRLKSFARIGDFGKGRRQDDRLRRGGGSGPRRPLPEWYMILTFDSVE